MIDMAKKLVMFAHAIFSEADAYTSLLIEHYLDAKVMCLKHFSLLF